MHKPLSAGGGGLLVVNDVSFVSAVRKVVADSPGRSAVAGFREAAQLAAKSILYRAPWYGLLVQAGLIDLRREGFQNTPINVGPQPELNRRLMVRSLNEFQSRWTRQAAISRDIAQRIGNRMPVARFASAGELWNGYLVPMLLDDRSQREAMLDFLHRRSIDAFLLWPECLDMAASYGDQCGSCQRFEEAFKRLLLLPCYAELTNARVGRIKDAIGSWTLASAGSS
jgi:perosamine synthetase